MVKLVLRIYGEVYFPEFENVVGLLWFDHINIMVVVLLVEFMYASCTDKKTQRQCSTARDSPSAGAPNGEIVGAGPCLKFLVRA